MMIIYYVMGHFYITLIRFKIGLFYEKILYTIRVCFLITIVKLFFLFTETRLPIITEPDKDENGEVIPYEPFSITCKANAVPPPIIYWRRVKKTLLI